MPGLVGRRSTAGRFQARTFAAQTSRLRAVSLEHVRDDPFSLRSRMEVET
jgi:hypothetical protein